MLKVLDLFSGIGGFSLGLERTGGFKTIAFCEIDPFCRAVLAKHWPDVPCYEDVCTIDPPECDVITAGFPCQDVSNAGKRAGISASRSGLYREAVRCLRMVPQAVGIMENVAALLFRGMGTVLGDLAEIGRDAEWDCLSPCMFGVPQRRDRCFIVANPYSREPKVPHQRTILHQQTFPVDASWAAFDAQGVRIPDGPTDRVDIGKRIRACGNSVVPQIVEMIGNAILASHPGTGKTRRGGFEAKQHRSQR